MNDVLSHAKHDMDETVLACECRIAALQIERDQSKMNQDCGGSLQWDIYHQKRLIEIAVADYRATADRFGL